MINNLDVSDNDLLALFKGGDQAAFNLIYERYWQLLYVAACKVIKDEDEAKDVVQEVFISLLSKGADLQIHGNLSNYLFTAVRYKVFDFISRKKIRTDYLDSLNDFITSNNYTTDRTLLEKEINSEIFLIKQ
jgi:RNA polymerase sigma-70 factor (ECF subfamily)